LFQDSFSYTNGNLAGQGSWTGSGTGTPIQVQSGNLSYPGLAPSSGSELFMSGSGASATSLLSSAVTNGSVYCSFLMEMSGPPNNYANNNFFVAFGNSSSAGCQLGLYPQFYTNFMFDYGGNYGASGYESPDNTTLSVGSTYLVVLSYNFVPGANNDSVSLWIDPSSSTFGNATAPTPTGIRSQSSMSDPVSSIDRFIWTSANTNVVVDELRIGTTWADVTSNPEPSSWSFVAVGALLFFAVRRRVYTVGSSQRIGKNSR
jgi:hypothetical protein